MQVAQLQQAEDVWNVLGVLNYLQALVGKSGIVEELSAPGESLLLPQFRSIWETGHAAGVHSVASFSEPCPGSSSNVLVNSHAAGGAARLKATDGFVQGQSNVLRMLGYFSLIGLQRVHTLTGDYHGAMKVGAPLVAALPPVRFVNHSSRRT